MGSPLPSEKRGGILTRMSSPSLVSSRDQLVWGPSPFSSFCSHTILLLFSHLAKLWKVGKERKCPPLEKRGLLRPTKAHNPLPSHSFVTRQDKAEALKGHWRPPPLSLSAQAEKGWGGHRAASPWVAMQKGDWEEGGRANGPSSPPQLGLSAPILQGQPSPPFAAAGPTREKVGVLGGGNHKSQGGAVCVLHNNTSLCAAGDPSSPEQRGLNCRGRGHHRPGAHLIQQGPLSWPTETPFPQLQALHLSAPHLARPPIHRLLLKLLPDLKTDLRGANCGGGLDVEGGSLLLDLHGWFGGRSHRDLPKHHVDPWKKMASEVSQSLTGRGATSPSLG